MDICTSPVPVSRSMSMESMTASYGVSLLSCSTASGSLAHDVLFFSIGFPFLSVGGRNPPTAHRRGPRSGSGGEGLKEQGKKALHLLSDAPAELADPQSPRRSEDGARSRGRMGGRSPTPS